MHPFLSRTALLCTLALSAATLQAAPAPTPTEHFFDEAPVSSPRLSPSGRYLAIKVARPGMRDALAVVNLASGATNAVANFNDVDMGDFMWLNDERLVFDTTNRFVDTSVSRAPGLFGINRDGSNRVQLVMREGDDYGVKQGENTNIKKREMLKWNHFMLEQRGADTSDFVYVTNPQHDGIAFGNVDLKKVHATTLRVQTVARPANVVDWMLDHKGEPRIATSIDKTIASVHYLDPATSAWRVLASYNATTGGPGAFTPLAFGPDGTLYVVTYGDKDKAAVHTFDFATGKVNPSAKIVTDDYDFTGKLIFSKDKLLGMRMTTDAESTMWFDPAMKALQESIDVLLPATVNLLSVGTTSESPFVLVESYSDVAPTSYMVYNRDARTFLKIGSTRPNIVASQMGKQQAVRLKARDGLDLPAWLTLPSGSTGKNLPLVVLVHGGPWTRLSWGWSPDSQFLAARGYAVLEPEFRGSTGYGEKHFLAGLKQWGLAMQNDVADATRWAIAQGIADPARICIAGASYGGYSTLMGLVNDPGLYKCGVSWVGVTDINQLIDAKWHVMDDISDRSRKYGLPELIGDKVTDAAQLKATSPLAQAARIKQPLLLAFGREDYRVPVHYGEQFHKALKPHNPNVDFVVYPDEGHGWRLQKTNVDFWNRVDTFLGKHIGKP